MASTDLPTHYFDSQSIDNNSVITRLQIFRADLDQQLGAWAQLENSMRENLGVAFRGLWAVERTDQKHDRVEHLVTFIKDGLNKGSDAVDELIKIMHEHSTIDWVAEAPTEGLKLLVKSFSWSSEHFGKEIRKLHTKLQTAQDRIDALKEQDREYDLFATTEKTQQRQTEMEALQKELIKAFNSKIRIEKNLSVVERGAGDQKIGVNSDTRPTPVLAR